MKPWKMAEKQAAKILGGMRRVRVQYSESCEDVAHSKLSIEVKYGKQIPKWVIAAPKPCVINHTLLLFEIGKTQNYSNYKSGKPIEFGFGFGVYSARRVEFLTKGLDQAEGYGSGKPPILVMKAPRMRGLVACMYYEDYSIISEIASINTSSASSST